MPTSAPAARLASVLLDLLYPSRCVLCRRGGGFLCPKCCDSLPRADGPRCAVCWLPLRLRTACEACARHPLALAGIRSAYRYEGDAQRLVHALKFHEQTVLASTLAAPMARLVETDEGDSLVPVPLIGIRQRLRGYNQAALLAREVGRLTGLPVVPALRRTRSSPPQSRSASAEERRSNVEGAFAVRDASSVSGRRFIVIDDVATTGATLDACARALLAAGAAEVRGLTFARED